MTPYYQDDLITIFCGDCLEVMPQLESPVDAIIADWPYGTTACEWDSIIPLEPLWKECKRLIKSNGAVVLTASQPFTTILINAAGFDWFKYRWIWDKKGTANFALARFQPLRASEDILIFGNGRVNYFPQMIKGKMRGKGGGGDCAINGISPTYAVNDNYFPTDVIRISNANFSERGLHPPQKPIALMSYLIRTYTNPGELVLDNTMGSGTTLVAAKNTGRRAIGIEISEDYCKVAVDRLTNTKYISLPNGGSKIKVKQLELIAA